MDAGTREKGLERVSFTNQKESGRGTSQEHRTATSNQLSWNTEDSSSRPSRPRWSFRLTSACTPSCVPARVTRVGHSGSKENHGVIKCPGKCAETLNIRCSRADVPTCAAAKIHLCGRFRAEMQH